MPATHSIENPEGGLDLVGTLWVVFSTSASCPTLFLRQQDFATSLSENTKLWPDFSCGTENALP